MVGWGIRVPGASTQDEFWSVLQQKQCTISHIPAERWSRLRFWHPRVPEPGKSYSFAAGVLDDIWGFDPAVFGISPREAEQMDPQQRLLLQVTYEAIEDAGISPSSLAGQSVGVYVGASTLDYSTESFFDPSVATGHFMTGNTLSVISNRLSYIFDLNGPSFTVDTACSSSLVALNEAVKALNSGEIDTAIVAGVNALVSPFPFVGFAQATMLSPEGLCRAFDARGLGYVRSEGCLAFVLRRQDALSWPGQRAIANIVDVGINADGKTVGMSLPSQDHQARLLHDIYKRAGIDLNDLAFIEAHGTGTRVGDPAEAYSIGHSLAVSRTNVLPIGSVKTNIGHLEPASGLAGLAKACLALKHDLLPASLHCEEPNPNIDFEALNLKVATEAISLANGKARRFAGVNSFGFGGTNAHVLLCDPDPPERSDPSAITLSAERTAGLLVLSAKSRDALKALAGRYAAALDDVSSNDLQTIQSAAWYRKKHFDETLVVSGRDPEYVSDALAAFSSGEDTNAVVSGRQPLARGRCAFVFSGNGSQWPGMGQAAYEKNADFKETFDSVEEIFESLAGISLKEQLFSETLSEQLGLTSIAQPLLFAVQVALGKALGKLGLKPDVVLGHSIGEAAAAVISQKMALEDGVRLVFHRSKEQEAVAGSGTMAALVLPKDDALAAIASANCDTLEVAAVNSPKSVSLSGPNDDLAAFAKYARQNHLAFRKVDLNYPFHSSLIAAVEKPFKDSVGELSGTDSDVAYISTVTGDLLPGPGLTTEYWWRNLREPVQFKDAISRALDEGVRQFIEIGPKPILQSYIRQTANARDADVTILASLTNQEDRDRDRDPVLEIIATALLNGFDLDETALFGSNPNSALSLPTYPWQNEPYRFQKTGESNADLVRSGEHPLLGWRSDETSNTWVTHIDTQVLPFLADHEIDGQIIFPGAGYIETALAAGRLALETDEIEVRDFDIVQALFLSKDHLTEVQTQFFPETGTVEISSRRRLGDDDWALNARGRLYPAVVGTLPSAQLDEVSGEKSYSAADIYQTARSFGLNYGSTFRRASSIEKISDRSYRVRLATGISNHVYGLHPAELDACFHGIFAYFADRSASTGDPKAYVPVHFEKVQLVSAGSTPVCAEITARRISEESILVDFVLYDAANKVVATIFGGRFRAVRFGTPERSSDLVFHFRTEPLNSEHFDPKGPDTELSQPAQLVARLSKDASQLLDSEHESESRLLLEAAAQRLAIDVLKILEGRHGAIREQDFPDTLRLYLNALLNWLVHVEAAVETYPGTYELADLLDLPEFDLLITAVLQERPEEIAAATLLARCRNVAVARASGKAALFEPSSAVLDHFRFASPDAVARIALAKKWLAPLLESWPEHEPLRVLDLAGSGLELAKFVIDARPQGKAVVTVLDPDPACASRLSSSNDVPSYIEVLDQSKDAEKLQDTTFDLILSCGRLHEFSNVGTTIRSLVESNHTSLQFAAIEPERSLLAEAIFGLKEGWLETATSDQFPLSKLKTDSEWVSTLKLDADINLVNAERAVVKGHPANIIYGRVSAEARHDVDPQTEHETTTAWLILCGERRNETECARALAAKLETLNLPSKIVVGPQNSDADLSDTLSQAFADAALARAEKKVIVYLPGYAAKGEQSLLAIARQCMNAVSIAAMSETDGHTFALVAPAGSGETKRPIENLPEQSAVWSFARVLQNEFPAVDLRRLDVSLDQEPSGFAQAVLEAIGAKAYETELVKDNTGFSAVRVVPGFRDGASVTPEAVTLGFEHAGSLSALDWRGKERQEPGTDEVEIEVAATGLNFRDVMWTLGMLPEEALEDGYGGPSLGLECSGRVLRAGKNVKHLKQGDPVVAFTRAGFASHVTVPSFAVAKIDESQDLVGAASVPVAFLTAYYALIKLGELKKDQWLLLHGGAGGVGLAALQIAKSVGARVIATAGTDEKRDLLTTLGADHVLDSRSLDFSVEVQQLTNGQGVHAVLNSLAGEAMERSIQLVRPFGRFLELGKRDFYANTKIGLRPFRKNVSYFGIDVDQLLSCDLEAANDLIIAVFDALGRGEFTLLPFRLFRGADVQDAYRLMQRSGHIGKILVSPPPPQDIKLPATAASLEFDADGFHVVIGGLGGFGGEVARWLADHGARKIVLTSRSGHQNDEHAVLFEELSDRAIDIRAIACDVTDRNAMHNVLQKLRETAPIAGVIHSAMVLDDGLITSLDNERFEKVLAPKVEGARNLDELTAGDDLDYFILFSSLTTMVGNPGQANYVAANGFLEGLARERRTKNLPGLAVGWGAIKDVGFLARNTDVSEKLSKHLGNAMIDAREGLDILSEAIGRDQGMVEDAVIHIGRFDWNTMNQALPVLKQPLYRHLAYAHSNASTQQGALDLAGMIAGKSESEARQIICALLARELGEILRLPAEEIGFKRPLADFGMDSLMGLELRMGIQKRFNMEIPLVSLSGGTCIEDFANQVLRRLKVDTDAEDTLSGSELVKDELVSQHLDVDLTDQQKKAVSQIIDNQQKKIGGLLQ